MAAATVVVVPVAEVVVGTEDLAVDEVAGPDTGVPGRAVAAVVLDVVGPEAEVVGPDPEGLLAPEQPAMALAISATATAETDRGQAAGMAFMPTETLPAPGRFQRPARESLQRTRGTGPGLIQDVHSWPLCLCPTPGTPAPDLE
jgi:hypothetical protein